MRERECKGRCGVAEGQGIGAHNRGGDGSEVVCVEGLLGDARPVPYTVESCPSGPRVDFARAPKRAVTPRESAPVDSVASRCTWLPMCVLWSVV